MLIDLTTPNDEMWRKFRFPDGQPHLEMVDPGALVGAGATINCRITNSQELIEVLMAADIYHRNHPGRELQLNIAYLMAARMDRPMPYDGIKYHPFTLKVVADVLATGNFTSVSIFDPHSDVAPALLNAEAILPYGQVEIASALADIIVAPDAGASKRVALLAEMADKPWTQAFKHRDMSTGHLSGCVLAEPAAVDGKHCIIVDDICDGGRTFVTLAAKLREAGATTVDLYVSHGIFSGGYHLGGIDKIYTTNSYLNYDDAPTHMTVMDWWR